MSRRVAKAILYPLAALLTCASGTRAQGPEGAPFAVAAVMAGPQGFARPPLTAAVAGGYLYLPAGPVLIGAQGGATFMNARGSRARYAMGTAGAAVLRGATWQTYPFAGIGSGALRTHDGADTARVIFGVGIGTDVGLGAGPLTVGSRIGYITRSAADDGSIAYLTISFGVGLRPGRRELLTRW